MWFVLLTGCVCMSPIWLPAGKRLKHNKFDDKIMVLFAKKVTILS